MAETKNTLEIIKGSWPQIEGVLCNASVSILEKTVSGVPPYDFKGSGTLIAIKDRLFVATAAHIIPRHLNERNLWVLSKKRHRPCKDGVVRILRFKKDKSIDVGYLELSLENISDYLDCEPCPIERVRILGPGRSEQLSALVGAPQEFVKPKERAEARAVFPTIKPYLITPIPVKEWPNVPSINRPPQDDVDIFLNFPRDGITELATDEPLVYVTAEGYSGGGIWDWDFDPEGLWQPTDAVLFGIQSSWNSTKRYLRAIQIQHWLRLIYEDYSDLQSTLDKHFPTLHPDPA